MQKLSQIQLDREILHATSRAKAGKFPVFSPVSRESAAESGSQWTPSTAIESIKSTTQEKILARCSISGQIQRLLPTERDERKLSAYQHRTFKRYFLYPQVRQSLFAESLS